MFKLFVDWLARFLGGFNQVRDLLGGPNFERLEPRVLMDVTVTQDVPGGAVHIQGDGGDNTIEISAGENPGEIIVIITEVDGTPIQTFPFSGVTSIDAALGDGADHLRIENQVTDPTGNPLNLTVDGGNGEDAIMFMDHDGNSSINSGEGDDLVMTGDGNHTIMSGGGHDYVVTGSGKDSVDLGTGNDDADTGLDNDTVNGGVGDDNILLGGGDDAGDGGVGIDVVDGQGGRDTVRGGFDRDFLSGEHYPDYNPNEDYRPPPAPPKGVNIVSIGGAEIPDLIYDPVWEQARPWWEEVIGNI